MPQMTDERVRAGLTREEDLSLLHEVSMKTAGVSHLEMCIQCGTCGGSCPAAADWNCCGATEYLGINLIPAYSLIARNLALAVKQMDGAHTLVAPCSACYLNLAKADHYMQERPALGVKVNEALAAGGLEYKPGTLDVRHLLDVLIYDVGLDAIKKKVTRPLSGLKVAPYMGCNAWLFR